MRSVGQLGEFAPITSPYQMDQLNVEAIHSPSYKGLHPSSVAASRVKRRNRGKDTAPEVLLRSALWHAGLRFRKHRADLPGKPDIVFPGVRVAVFCDGDFWHGRNWETLQPKLDRGANPGYWSAKIASNIARDARNDKALADAGWQVIRLWETDIKRDPAVAVGVVAAVVRGA